MRVKLFGVVTLLTLFFTVLWIVFMGIDLDSTGLLESLEQAVDYGTHPGVLFYLTYINAVIFTILATMLFAGLYLELKSSNPELSIIGIIFVPIYAIFNLFSYFSQISILPILTSNQTMLDNDVYKIITGFMVQAWPGSGIAVFNNLAYALLGIPSIAFGLILIKKRRYAKISGLFLIASAITSIIGIVGIVMQNKVIGMGSAAGGVLFIFALIFLSLMFFKEYK